MMPQGLTPDLCGLASHTHYQSAARVLHCSADGQVLPLCRHIPLPVSPTVFGRRRPWALSAFGLRRCADVALCATYLCWHEMTRSSYGAIISHSRLNNLLYLAVIQHIDTHTQLQIQSGIMQRCAENSLEESETHPLCTMCRGITRRYLHIMCTE